MIDRRLVTAAALALVACGSEPAPPTPTPPATTPATEPAVAPPPTSPPPSTDPGAAAVAPAEEPVDLLRATRAAVATSSAYRDDPAQVARLVDGDLETAWNSRSGDLTGAWIDVAIPAEASVESIALTVGFTHRTASADLFDGNHRVSRVRVLREGTELGAFDLDSASRALQTIAVRGAGGTYRIEIAGVVPGSHADWREVCISELRVLGRAPGAVAGSMSPQLAVGALPALDDAAPTVAPPAAPASFPPAPAAFATLGATLSSAGIERLFRTGDILEGDDRPPVAVTAAADDSGTWVCVRSAYRDPRCFVVAPGEVSIHQPSWRPRGGNDEVRVTYMDDQRTWMYVDVPLDGPARASRRGENEPSGSETALPAPATRAPPTWLGALEGLEIASSYRTIAAVAAGWLTVCREDDGFRCPPPSTVQPLLRENVVLEDADQMFDDAWSIAFHWSSRGGEIEESGQASVFVRVTDSGLTLLATAITAMDRRTPAADGSVDVSSMECFDIDMISEDCIQAGAPSGQRTREDDEGNERSLGRVSFQRAPDDIPATGLADPLSVSMEGAWTMLPDGGLRRRARRCPEL